MSQKEDLFAYDEQESVRYIMKKLPAEMRSSVSEDAIYYIVDIMYDYYEANGFMDESMDENAEIEIVEDDLIASVMATIMKDKVMTELTEEQVRAVVEAELSYCDSVDMFG